MDMYVWINKLVLIQILNLLAEKLIAVNGLLNVLAINVVHSLLKQYVQIMWQM